MVRAVESMQVLYGMILAARSQQGYWLTNLELAVQQRLPEEKQWMVGFGAYDCVAWCTAVSHDVE